MRSKEVKLTTCIFSKITELQWKHLCFQQDRGFDCYLELPFVDSKGHRGFVPL